MENVKEKIRRKFSETTDLVQQKHAGRTNSVHRMLARIPDNVHLLERSKTICLGSAALLPLSNTRETRRALTTIHILCLLQQKAWFQKERGWLVLCCLAVLQMQNGTAEDCRPVPHLPTSYAACSQSKRKPAAGSQNNLHFIHCDFIKQYAEQLCWSEFFRLYFVSDAEFFSRLQPEPEQTEMVSSQPLPRFN